MNKIFFVYNPGSCGCQRTAPEADYTSRRVFRTGFRGGPAVKRICCLVMFVLTVLFVFQAGADEVYSSNRAGNRLYEEGRYKEAIEKYDDALITSPGNKKVYMNKGSAHYKLGEFDEAISNYEKASGIEGKKAGADLYYNKGTALFAKAEAGLASGQPDMNAYKKAKEAFINSLDIHSADNEAKWNLELVQSRIKQLEEQQQNQDQDCKDNKDKQDEDKEKKDQQDQQEKNGQDQNDKRQEQQNKDTQQKENKENQEREQKEKKDGEKKQNESAKKEDKKGKDKPLPTPEEKKEDMEKKKALRLIQQYADDAEDLKKPQEKTRKSGAGESEKDW